MEPILLVALIFPVILGGVIYLYIKYKTTGRNGARVNPWR